MPTIVIDGLMTESFEAVDASSSQVFNVRGGRYDGSGHTFWRAIACELSPEDTLFP